MMPHAVTVLGNANIDLLLGPLPRLPSWGHELIVPTMETRAAGAVGYTVGALDRLGLSSLVVGTIGDDGWGEFIRSEFSRLPLADLSGLETVPGALTGLSATLLDQRGQRGFVTYAGALDRLDAGVLARHQESMLAARYLLVCGYFFMPALRGAPLLAFLQAARRAGVTVVFDTGWDIDDWPPSTVQEVLSLLPAVDIFAPNEDEARALTGLSDPAACARQLLAHGAGAVALKLGPRGSLWADSAGAVLQPGHAVRAVDTTGAGDSFNAALLYGREQGWNTPRILAFANAFCSVVVSRLHDRFPSAEQTMAMI